MTLAVSIPTEPLEGPSAEDPIEDDPDTEDHSEDQPMDLSPIDENNTATKPAAEAKAPTPEPDSPAKGPDVKGPDTKEEEPTGGLPEIPTLGPQTTLLALGLLLVFLLVLHWTWEPFRAFIFEYYWGPILADARDEPVSGVSEGYNPINTLTYGLVFLLGGLLIYRLLQWLRIPLDERFILATLPLIVLGGLARSLEDTGLFEEPLSYLFIAPVIYFTLAVGAILVLLFAAGIRHVEARLGGRAALGMVLVTCLLLLSTYQLLWVREQDLLVHLVDPLPILLLLVAIMVGGYQAWGVRVTREPVLVLGMGGLFSVGLALFWFAAFVDQPWSPANPERNILWQVIVVWTLALLFTVVVFHGLIRYRPSLASNLQPFLTPLAIALFAAHYLDGAATFLGIDQYGYVEKHVLPDLFITWFGTAFIMLPLKALVVIVVVYLLDVVYKKEARESPELFMLTKLLIITLGLSPGVRDVARIYLGV